MVFSVRAAVVMAALVSVSVLAAPPAVHSDVIHCIITLAPLTIPPKAVHSAQQHNQNPSGEVLSFHSITGGVVFR
jgi:hypothetical protein